MLAVVIDLAARLQTCTGTVFSYVGNVANLAALQAMPPSFPAAYVVPLALDAEPNSALDGVVQLQAMSFGVVLAVKHAGDATGAKAIADLVAARRAVALALQGWVPPDCGTVVTFTSGSLDRLEAGTVWWTDEFAVGRIYSAWPQT